MLNGSLNAIAALSLGILAATSLLFLWIKTNSLTKTTLRTLMKEAENSVTFLFDEERLADATPRARDLIGGRDKNRSDWEALLSLLSARFPHLRSQVADLATVGRKMIQP